LPHPQIKELEEQLKKDDFAPRTVARYLFRARHFLRYLASRGIAIEQVTPSDVRAYRSRQLTTYCKKHGRHPLNERQWTTLITAPISRLLRLAFGVWPPGSEPDPIIEEFRRHLVAQGFSTAVIPSQLSDIRCFLRYLKERRKTLASVESEDVSRYLNARVALYRRRNGRMPQNLAGWRHGQTGPIHRLLRMVHGQWPPARPAANVLELSHGEILSAYTAWMIDLRGLSQPTVQKNSHAARVFLEWLGDAARFEKLPELTVLDLDRFLAWRNPKLRRATRSGVVHCLRDFLRFLRHKGYLEHDLASAVPRVTLYRFEDVPKAFRPDQVRAVLEHIYKDKTPVGLRDYAIALLLATYGLRAGEIARLRLEDIDWRREEFCVIQSKSYLPLRLPLSIEVGNAILRYLRRGRPHSKAREVFLRSRAPQGPFRRASSLGSMIQRRLQQAAIHVDGRRGTHAFRYAHAVNLLRAQVPFKTIGDLLGHRSPDSTAGYLKLAADDLRSVALEVPGGAR
jgi:site-specific recombinase XerD